MVVVVVVRRGRVVVLVVSIIVHLGKVGFFKCLITECSKCGTKKALFSRVFLSQSKLSSEDETSTIIFQILSFETNFIDYNQSTCHRFNLLL